MHLLKKKVGTNHQYNHILKERKQKQLSKEDWIWKTQEQINTTGNALRIEMSPLNISQGSKLNSLWSFITGHAQACQVLN